jgi:hypothetical protein
MDGALAGDGSHDSIKHGILGSCRWQMETQTPWHQQGGKAFR